ncbi:MAG TPA: tetratricopeptide repeat protein, partial [Kofleriaceae bacterium]|nr:tetratricopeptide repeat protein [Kofleriaceae bacterium]
MRWLAAALVAATAFAPLAHAEDDGARLAALEAEARNLSTNLPVPNVLRGGAAGPRKLTDAQVAYSLGDYDTAALGLFDLANRPGPEQETAMFYLAESLFQKGDRGAARGYYEQVIARNNPASRYYQPSLERLLEIAIVQHDAANVDQAVAALDRVSPGLRLASVPYVRGKLAYAQGKYDEAIAYFQQVAKGSDQELAAAYYLATTYVAKKDLARATDLFTDLINRRPKTANDRRIIELSQLALGRLYYERDLPSKSIDSYLLVDRHSDLFPDALYEVAWVYVKGKQYDKALRALELLNASDPQSQKTPTVRILEGNLRIRKAQLLRAAEVGGTLDNRDADDPAIEYDKAVQEFTETHDLYMPSYLALSQMVDSKADPAQFLGQIAGRNDHVFQAAAPVPEAAVQYLRDEPAVQRVVEVEGDLGEVHANIVETEAMIARLEGVLVAKDKGAAYPALANRRSRIGALEDEVIKLRSQLADQAEKLTGDAPGAAGRRQQVAAYAAAPSAERLVSDRRIKDLAGYDTAEQATLEVEAAIGQAQAMAVALHKYALDAVDMPSDQRATIGSTIADAGREAEAIENELAEVHREIQRGRDVAGLGDDAVVQARTTRQQLKMAEDAEARALAGMLGRSKDRDQSARIAALADRAGRLAEQLAQTERQIDQAVDQGLAEARDALAEARTMLAAYKTELAASEADVHEVGGSVLGASFASVKDKFYDIVIRSDVGNVDVAWSQKSDDDDELKRLNLSRQRELKQLKDEFKDILDGGTQKPSAPSKK